jgi:hypothetical protein
MNEWTERVETAKSFAELRPDLIAPALVDGEIQRQKERGHPQAPEAPSNAQAVQKAACMTPEVIAACLFVAGLLLRIHRRPARVEQWRRAIG